LASDFYAQDLKSAATSICRVFLDPVRYGYYWDTSLVLILIGLAPMLIAPRDFARNLGTSLRARFALPQAQQA
jgi:hypothetical protein